MNPDDMQPAWRKWKANLGTLKAQKIAKRDYVR